MIGLLLLLGTPLPGASPAPLPVSLKEASIEEHPGATLPLDLRFQDQSGRTVRLGEMLSGDSPTLLVLAWYECPMLCGLVLRGVVEAAQKTNDVPYRLLSVSFDPRDTPERAAKKRQSTLAALGPSRPAWPFLVGNPAAIDALTTALGVHAPYDEASKQFAHPAAVFVLTPDGQVSRYLYGVSYPAGELRQALQEAQSGQTRSSLAAVLMTCFRYDPNASRYGSWLVAFFRLSSGLTLLAVAVFLWSLHRREKATQS